MNEHALARTMTNTTGGLSRLWCGGCQGETIHRSLTCIHCGSLHRAYPVRDLAGKWVAKGLTIKRGKRS